MVSKERAAQLWERYVGSQAPREFMELAQEQAPRSVSIDIREAVQGYVDELDATFGPGTSAQAPGCLEDALVQHIVDSIGVAEDQPWQGLRRQ